MPRRSAVGRVRTRLGDLTPDKADPRGACLLPGTVAADRHVRGQPISTHMIAIWWRRRRSSTASRKCCSWSASGPGRVKIPEPLGWSRNQRRNRHLSRFFSDFRSASCKRSACGRHREIRLRLFTQPGAGPAGQWANLDGRFGASAGLAGIHRVRAALARNRLREPRTGQRWRAFLRPSGGPSACEAFSPGLDRSLHPVGALSVV